MYWGGLDWLQQRITGRLPQSARQLSAVLQDDLGGDDSQVDGQQLVALHHLALVTLTVVSQQLSPGQMTPCSQPRVIWINRMAAPKCLPVVIPGEHPNGGKVIRKDGYVPGL